MVAARRGTAPASSRVVTAALVGVVAAVATGVFGSWHFASSVGWVAAAATFLVWTWSAIAGMDGRQTASHAIQEDPSKHVTELIVLGASIASLIAVGYLLAQANDATGTTQGLAAALGVVSVAVSWLVVHTLFTLRYALLYYTDGDRGIDFGGSGQPCYNDFAYVAFTVGMTFQVSDTTLTTKAVRSTVLRHALLSYLFGSLILASTVNLIASLASSTH
jgi:uncharacterized membrane protein